MNFDDIELTLLSEGKIFGNRHNSKLEAIKNYGTKAAITDLCILTGSYLCTDINYNIPEDNGLKGRTSWFWTTTYNYGNDVRVVNRDGAKNQVRQIFKRTGAIRPVLKSPTIFSLVFLHRVIGYNGTEEVEYGEYPQYAPDSKMQSILDAEYHSGLKKTGNSYTFDSVKYDNSSTPFTPNICHEYEYLGKKYIRIMANTFYNQGKFTLSNGETYQFGDYVWVEVLPVKWLIDYKEKLLISKFGLVSGIRFLDKGTEYRGDFDKTEMKEYLDKYMLHDLLQSVKYTRIEDMTAEERKQLEEARKELEKRRNPYGFNTNN